LWFNGQAEQAANFYVSIFPNSRINAVERYPEGSPGQPGAVMTVSYELDGQIFNAINGGPEFPFSEAVSFYVHCQTQAEVDYYWEQLSQGGEEVQCGWLKDKFGLSWQIVPDRLVELLGDPNPEKAHRVMLAMLQMVKLDIAALEQAYAHE
jgi:predicted 3-demethylubiquinone-9 3-methyltransferase (glyoxalase superfamily)